MRILQIITGFVALFMLSSCGEKQKHPNIPEDKVIPMNIQKGGEFESLELIRQQASAMIEYRVKNADKPYQFITYAYWYPEFVWNRGSMSKEHEYLGFWIKFEDNFDYSYGYFETVMGGGRYHFRLDDNAMIMVDNDILIEPKIWTANHNGEAIALIGTHELGINNGMQIKLVPLDNQPSRG